MKVPGVFSKTFMAKLLRNYYTSALHFTKISKTHNSKFKPYAGMSCLLEWLTREEKDFGVQHWTPGYNMVKETTVLVMREKQHD